ncbi:MAG: YdcH family protein [Betaproteobacteria bacterium]
MFPEYRELISKLKTSDRHFATLFEKHNELDAKIKRMDQGIDPTTPEGIEELKKQKLHLKDQLYTVLLKAAKA